MKLGKDEGQKRRKAERAGEADEAARRGPRHGRRRLCRLDAGKRLFAVIEEVLADIGHPQHARRAFEETNAQLPFELGDMLAQQRFRQIERAGGGGEAAMPDDGDEMGDVVQVLHQRIPSLNGGSVSQRKRCVGIRPSTGPIVSVAIWLAKTTALFNPARRGSLP